VALCARARRRADLVGVSACCWSRDAPTYGRDALYGLLLTFGAAMVIEELIRLAGSTEQQLAVPDGIAARFAGDIVYAKYRLLRAPSRSLRRSRCGSSGADTLRRADQGRRARQ
jgi:hypothetical protein